MENKQNGWNEYQRMVIDRLDESRQKLHELDAKINEIRQEDIAALLVEIATLKTKASLWGGTTGAITGVLTALLALAIKLFAS